MYIIRKATFILNSVNSIHYVEMTVVSLITYTVSIGDDVQFDGNIQKYLGRSVFKCKHNDHYHNKNTCTSGMKTSNKTIQVF